MAIATTRYGTGDEIPPIDPALEAGGTYSFAYKASDSQAQMSSEGGVHLMIVEGGRLIFTDDDNTFLVTFNPSDITITWKHPYHRLDYKDEVVFIFNAFAKESQGMVHYRYVATGSQTTFSGADADGNTLAYSVSDSVQVFKNGAYVPQTDYTATSLTSIVLDSGASASDTITVWALQNLVDQTDLVSAINSSSASATAAATSATNASNDADDAEKWADHNFNTLFTLSDGVTTGYSSKSRARDAERFAEFTIGQTFAATGENTSTHYSAKHYANDAANSASSASSAQSYANAAATSATAAQAALDAFEAVYIGASASDPSTDANGDALTAGDQYFNTTSNNLYVYTGSAWQIAGNPTNLAGLNDVDNSISPSSGQVLQYDGSDWDAATLNLTTTLASLTDTNISGIQDDHILRYDSVSSKWKNEIAGYLTSSNPLSALSDVAMYSGQSSGDVLAWDGSQWDAASGYLTTAVTNVATGTGLSGGPITSTGTISLANTAVTAASYTNADITVDAQGRITAASDGTGVAITALNNATENEIVTVGSTTTELDAESNLTFDGTYLYVNASSGILLPDDKNLMWGDNASGASFIEGSKAGDYLKFWVSSGANSASASLYLFEGEVNLPTAVSLKFEGATSNAYDTELTVADPSANNVITLPNETGTVLTSASSLSSLSDVSYAGPSDGDVLTWNNGNSRWENQTGGGGSLATLTDTNINSPTNNQFIRYDNANSEWKNESVTIPSAMTDLSDVSNSMSANSGDVLTYSGSEWSSSGDFLTGSDSIENLNDVAAMTPSTGDYLYYNGSQWTNSSTVLTTSDNLDDLSNVQSSMSPSTGDFLYYNGANWTKNSNVLTTGNNLDDLSNVQSSMSPSTGDHLYWNGSTWTKSTTTLTTTSSLDQLSNVTASSPNNGEVLQYDGSNWISANTTTTLATLTDTTISSVQDDQILRYNNAQSKWENENLSLRLDELTQGTSDTTLQTNSGYLRVKGHTYTELEATEDIVFDHGGSYYTKFQETGTDYLTLRIDTDVQFKAVQQNSDIKFMGMDDSNEITALTLDMSEEGKALFNHHLVADGNGSSGGVTLQDGKVEIRTGTGSVAQVDFFCESSNLHKVTVKAPPHANFTGDVNFQLPSSEGTTGQVLQTDGSGNTSWTTAGGGGGASDLDDLSDVKKGGTDFTNSMMIGATSTGTLSSASDNLFIATSGAGDALTSGTYNIGIGNFSLSSIQDSDGSIGVGYSAGHNNNSSYGIYIGHQAFQYATGEQSTIIGYQAARGSSGNTTAHYSTVVGMNAALNVTTAQFGVHVGHRAGKNVSSGGYSTNIGSFAGEDTSTGIGNTNVGYEAGREGNNTGNVFVGRLAGHGVNGVTAADYNVGVGYNSLTGITSGEGNVCIGKDAGDSITSADNNTIIGTGMDPDSATAGGEIVIGTDTRRIHVDNTGAVQFNSVFRFPNADGTSNQVLQTNGSGTVSWATVSGGGSSTLNGLTDVTISSPSSGQVIKYDGSGWVNGTDADSGGGGGGITTGKAIAMAMVFG